MKPTALRYGLYGTLAIVVLSAIHFFFIFPNASYNVSEVAGYLTMFLSMFFVFLGIRYYRDQVNGGHLSFVQGLKTGALISVVPAIAFGIFDLLYTQVINPTWLKKYQDYYAAELKKTTSPEKLDEVLKKFESEAAVFNNPVMLFLIMTATVFIIGLIVTIISTVALKRNKPKPAMA
ncbi:MAG: DUF4199 domain-containing protein [Chitinophagaceae bacterium]|jgi:hypothetical protein|nr:MAG: DUF4199 domain-containing protein [Chitinophagaceae bacterium]